MKDILLIIAGVILIGGLAQCEITPDIGELDIPITGQTLGVLLVSYVYPRNIGAIAVLTYVLLGVLGLPLFSDFSSGWSVIMSKSGGYIVGFIIASLYIFKFHSKRGDYKFLKRVELHTLGSLIILTSGVIWLSNFIGIQNALIYGVLPYLIGAAIKILLGSWLSQWIDRQGLSFLK